MEGSQPFGNWPLRVSTDPGVRHSRILPLVIPAPEARNQIQAAPGQGEGRHEDDLPEAPLLPVPGSLLDALSPRGGRGRDAAVRVRDEDNLPPLVEQGLCDLQNACDVRLPGEACFSYADCGQLRDEKLVALCFDMVFEPLVATRRAPRAVDEEDHWLGGVGCHLFLHGRGICSRLSDC